MPSAREVAVSLSFDLGLAVFAETRWLGKGNTGAVYLEEARGLLTKALTAHAETVAAQEREALRDYVGRLDILVSGLRHEATTWKGADPWQENHANTRADVYEGVVRDLLAFLRQRATPPPGASGGA